MTRSNHSRDLSHAKCDFRSARFQAAAEPHSPPVRLRRIDRKALLLGTALVSVVIFGYGSAAQAQIVPPAAPCDNVVGTTVTCTGDLQPGIAVANPYTTLNVNGVTADIAPAAGVDGIYFAGSGTLNSDTGSFGITTTGNDAYGIRMNTAVAGAITLTHTGDVATGGDDAIGIAARTTANGAVTVTHTGNIATQGVGSRGVLVRSTGTGAVTVTQSGNIATQGFNGHGIFAFSTGSGDVTVTQTGNITTQGGFSYGVFGNVALGDVTVTQTGNIATQGARGVGLLARSTGAGDVRAMQTGNITTQGNRAVGVIGRSTGGGTVSATQTGTITTFGEDAHGIVVGSDGLVPGSGADVTVMQSGDIAVNGLNASGILGGSDGGDVTITVGPGGNVQGGTGTGAGVGFGYGSLRGVNNTLINWGTLSALSGTAVRGSGGSETINNYGSIIGHVTLGNGDDFFDNMSGGLFDARQTSDFGGGTDLFRNRSGGLVRTAADAGVAEATVFEGLERFENRGTISMVDGREGDSFTISNTPGGTDHTFNGAGGSTLAVDAFLGAPGSTSDTLTIEGDVSGRTEITVNNTNGAGGALNTAGIPVVFATGATPDEGGFFLNGPIDAGFFEYDLFFEPTGSGQWELRSSLGAGSQVLPQLITASQDIWYQGSSVWFDRSADLRVLLARGNAPAADLGSKSLGAAAPTDFTPAVWVRGSVAKLDRDGDSNFTSFGRSVSVELERDLETTDFQMGLDLGQRNLLSQGDILVFGMLGGFVHGDLDYNTIDRDFDFTGGQVGAYATYLKGGLFVDTLFNAHIYELDANGALGYPNNDLDATTLGVRTDAGYRFGSFSGGAFLEPLATIAVTWADIDSFSLGGNSVKFDNDANVRGRLGLRAGTSMPVWNSTIMEPFVTGSLWGHLAGDNQATLVSGGQTFRLEDDFEDVWGEVSAGVNFFNFSETTSVFAKVDVTFGDDVSGVGGKAGMRVAW